MTQLLRQRLQLGAARTHVFVSYSRRDQQSAEAVLRLLAAAPQRIDPWYDQDLHPGSQWRPELFQQIQQSDVLLFLVSRHSLTSLFCHLELSYASLQGKEILPLFLEPRSALPMDDIQAEWEARDWTGLADNNWARLSEIQDLTLPASLGAEPGFAQRLSEVLTTSTRLRARRRRLRDGLLAVVVAAAVLGLAAWLLTARQRADRYGSDLAARAALYYAEQSDIQTGTALLAESLAVYQEPSPSLLAAARQLVPVQADYQFSEGIIDVAAVPGTTSLLAGSDDARLILWDWEQTCAEGAVIFPVTASNQPSEILNVAASTDGEHLLAVVEDSETFTTAVYRWARSRILETDDRISRIVDTASFEARSLAFDPRPEAHRLAVGGWDVAAEQAVLVLYETRGWTENRRLELPPETAVGNGVFTLSFGPTGGLAAVMDYQQIVFWPSLDAPPVVIDPGGSAQIGGFVDAVITTERLIGSTAEGYLCTWALPADDFPLSQNCFGRREGQPVTWGIAASPDGQYAFSGGYDGGAINVWRLLGQRGELALTLDGATGQVNGLALSGRFLITGTNELNRSLRVWDWQTALDTQALTDAQLIEQLRRNPPPSRSTCRSPDVRSR